MDINTNDAEQKYINLLKNIMNNGDYRNTRNSKTKSIFGEKLEFDLKDKFPLLTTKKMFLRGIFEELIWFLNGKTDSKILEDKKVNIWKWNTSQGFIDNIGLPYKEGDTGNMYGFQLNHYGSEYIDCNTDYTGKGYNQIQYCINLLKTDKYSRRILMTTFAPDKSHQGVLYPCHGIVIQFYVKEENGKNYLSCHMYQRSADMFLGVPFNIASYSLLVYMLCIILNSSGDCDYEYTPDRLIMSFGDLHIYEEHFDNVSEQIQRTPRDFPQIMFGNKETNVGDFKWTDVKIENYDPHPSIKASMIA
jgi:thymidylate synthase